MHNGFSLNTKQVVSSLLFIIEWVLSEHCAPCWSLEMQFCSIDRWFLRRRTRSKQCLLRAVIVRHVTWSVHWVASYVLVWPNSLSCMHLGRLLCWRLLVLVSKTVCSCFWLHLTSEFIECWLIMDSVSTSYIMIYWPYWKSASKTVSIRFSNALVFLALMPS